MTRSIMRNGTVLAIAVLLGIGVGVAAADEARLTGTVKAKTADTLEVETASGEHLKLKMTENTEMEADVSSGALVEAIYARDDDRAGGELIYARGMADHEPDIRKVSGEVLMTSPSVMHVATERGQVEMFNVEDSYHEIDHEVVDREYINKGDSIEAWVVEKSPGDNVMVSYRKSARGNAPSEKMMEQSSKAMQRSSQKTDRGTAVEQASTASSRQGSMETKQARDEETRSYQEVASSPGPVMTAMVDRRYLPQTASSSPLIGLVGLAALLAAAGLEGLRRMS